ncbi:hypothetical protein CEXT_667431 [Caerostris extrusa]|uniref:Uncharacterized protein n=1 Tax=Caerostris extrusa TaxID=172846 RepID=A0AAV4RQ21_CAEEX|nr:hypothetical protein CEXT_667431 [Caerostris extrusa]
MDASETIYFHKICAISRDGDIFSKVKLGATESFGRPMWKMDFLMHFGALLNRLMLLEVCGAGGRLICRRDMESRKVSESFLGQKLSIFSIYGTHFC